jgi:hypothetical protein
LSSMNVSVANFLKPQVISAQTTMVTTSMGSHLIRSDNLIPDKAPPIFCTRPWRSTRR